MAEPHPCAAQTPAFTNLYIFSADAFGSGPAATNGDGASPDSLVLVGGAIYGTANAGGAHGDGTVFRLDPSGAFTNFLDFNVGGFDPGTGTYTNSTGQSPNPGLLLVSNTLYGTTFQGGRYDAGTVFSIQTNGTGFSVLHSFDFTDGQGPSSGLTLYGNVLYGTTAGGGSNASGVVFQIALDSLNFGVVYYFTNQEEPYGGLVASSNLLYGFGRYGGTSSNGVVYRVGLDGTCTRLLNFDGTNGSSSYATPILAGNTLFGVTYQGGTNGGGNVFRIDTDGGHYTNLFSFEAQGGANTTGAYPYDMAGLVLSGGTLYGTTSVSGSGGQGTVFQINTDGSGFAILHSFQYSDGAQPDVLALSGGTLYGMTSYGIRGVSLGDGAIFTLALPPPPPVLGISWTGTAVTVTWTNAGYSLYAAPSLTSGFTNVPGAASPYQIHAPGRQGFFQLQSD